MVLEDRGRQLRDDAQLVVSTTRDLVAGAGIIVGIACVAAGLFGLWGLTVVYGQWSMRFAGGQGGSASYPPDFCERMDWVRQWGIGVGLLAIGVVGAALAIRLVRGNPRPKPPAGGRGDRP